MATLTGFQSASAEQVQSANQLNTLSRGTSPFQQGVEFTIVGFGYDVAEIDGKVPADARPQPVFKAKIGSQEVSLFVKPLTRSVACADGSVLDHKGTFNAYVRETICANRGKNDGEMLKILVDGCRDKAIVVERVPYTAKSKDDRVYATSLVDLHFKVD